MERRAYYRQLSAWFEWVETEADNIRINPNIFKTSSFPTAGVSDPCAISDGLENCFVIKEALQKLLQFLNASHQSGCSEKNCQYDPKLYKIKVSLKGPTASNPIHLSHEVKIRKKRGRKSKYELQQLALLHASNGIITS